MHPKFRGFAAKVGDLAPTVFGDMRKVTRIFARGDNIHGKAYVCYYTEWSDGAEISHSMREGEPVATLPAGSRWLRTELYPNW